VQARDGQFIAADWTASERWVHVASDLKKIELNFSISKAL
jgi:hypothetical protein